MSAYNFAIGLTPATLRRIVDCVGPERYDERLASDRFTLREMVAHLADCEVLFLDRIAIAHEHPGSSIEAFDEGQRAIDKHYSTRDLQHEMDVFENRRRDTLEFVQGLGAEDWTKTVTHPERGVLSISDLIAFLLGHDLYHLEQASHYLR